MRKEKSVLNAILMKETPAVFRVSSFCSRVFSPALLFLLFFVRTSPRIAPLLPSVLACPPISAGSAALSASLCTCGNSNRLYLTDLATGLWE